VLTSSSATSGVLFGDVPMRAVKFLWIESESNGWSIRSGECKGNLMPVEGKK
jgi:hypothetical protein